ncbi:MAG TPA: DUF2971 domain-containing protein [Acidimicrobiales bacterium]|nr:DUF2971 domain-containing protein [Acidimicrobiales bacterium]
MPRVLSWTVCARLGAVPGSTQLAKRPAAYHRRVADEKLLFHYTGLDGLMGILASGALWATDVRYLNDTTESKFGFDKIDDLLANESSSRFPRPEPLKALSAAWRGVKEGEREARERQRLFVACFCTDPDLLSQWRGYGRHGYSIGFDRQALQVRGGQQPTGYWLREMVYDETEQRDLVAGILDHHVEGAPQELQVAPTRDMDLVSMARLAQAWSFGVGADLYQLANQFKHRGFQEEREVRAVHQVVPQSPTTIHVRGTAHGPVPYVCIDIGKAADTTVREVWVGPTPHQTEAADAVRDLLRFHGLSAVEVNQSPLPFRWQAG